jgi:hypothetical protein
MHDLCAYLDIQDRCLALEVKVFGSKNVLKEPYSNSVGINKLLLLFIVVAFNLLENMVYCLQRFPVRIG